MPLTIVNHVYREGKGVPLVLIHGFPVDHRMWDRCAEALMEITDADETVQYPIWAPDMPGAGASPVPEAGSPGTDGESGPVAADGALPEALDLMADAYVDLIKAAGYDQAVWAGLSMGGYLALDIQRRHPEAVAGLALLDTKGDADKPASRANRMRIAKECVEKHTTDPVMFFVDVEPGDSTIKRSPEYIDQFTEWIREQQPAGIAWRERMAGGRPDLNGEFPKITAPAAVICGENDPSSAPKVMEPLAKEMTGTEVVMTEIEDCGHFSAWERPETVADALHALMARVRGDQVLSK
ncbi:MAG: alpha/beta hydrolase [Bifidobacterium sp.]|nr:alpha/beta hydrolase [Bifidobacterium sp.]